LVRTSSRAGRKKLLPLLPPQPDAVARELGGDLRKWARRYVAQLIATETRLLYAGDWMIEAGVARAPEAGSGRWGPGPIPVLGLHGSGGTPSDRGLLAWDLNGSSDTLFLRAPSPGDSSRIKASRKLAREGILPPVLLWFISGLDAYVLLDGHDRLHASRLENLAPPARVLSSRQLEPGRKVDTYGQHSKQLERQLAHSSSPATVDRVNDRLRAMYPGPQHGSGRTRVWPMSGGAPAWLAEARALCGDSAPPGDLLEAAKATAKT